MTIMTFAVFLVVLIYSTAAACYGWAVLVGRLGLSDRASSALAILGWCVIVFAVGFAVSLSIAAFA